MGSVESPIDLKKNWFIGEDRVFSFTVFESDSTPEEIEAGTAQAQDITGWEMEWILRRNPEDYSVSISKATGGDGIDIPTGSDGVANLSITDDDTIGLPAGRYFHTLRRTDSGAEEVLSFGSAVLRFSSAR